MQPEPLLSRTFVLAWLASLFMGLSYMLFLHFPGYLDQLGASEVEIGVLFSVAALASVVARVGIGRAMDLHGRRPVILFGNVLNTIAAALYLTVSAVNTWAYGVRILHGLAAALLFTALFTYGADIIPASRRIEGLALFGVSGLLPIALAGVVGDVILTNGDYDDLFLTATLLAATALVLSLWLREQPGLVADGPRRGFLAAVRQVDLMPLWWVTLIFSISIQAYFVFMKTFTIEQGFGSVGLFFAFYSGTAITLRLFAGWLPDRVGEKRVLYPALGMLVIGFGVLAFAGSAPAVALAGMLCGAGHGYAFPITFAMVVTRARVAERGSALSVYTSLFDVALLISGPLFGLVIALSSYRAMWIVAGSVLAGGVLVFYEWERRLAAAPAVPAEVAVS